MIDPADPDGSESESPPHRQSDRPSRSRQGQSSYPGRKREPELDATDLLIPKNVSGYSIAACYLGLVSCFLPLIGLILALIALPCAVKALRTRKREGSYGSVTSDLRAIFGLATSSLTLLGHLIAAVVIVVKNV